MMNTANALLWSLRRSPATHVLAATELEDFDAPALVDAVQAIDPNVHLVLCGSATPDLVSLADQPLVELVSSVNDLMAWVERLNLEPAEPASESAPTRSFRHTPPGSVVLDARLMAVIERVLRSVNGDTHAVAVVLSDLAGMTIAETGKVPPDVAPLFAPLLGALFSTGVELGGMLGEPYSERLYVHGGREHQVYAVAVGERWILSAVRAPTLDGTAQPPMLSALQRAAHELAKEARL